MTRYRIQVDHEACQGTAMCLGIAPDHFELGPDQFARPLREIVDADDAVVEAAECCPLEAITLADADTGEPIT